MFGVVPKVLWSKRIEADERNMIDQVARCLLVESGGQNILIDTGYGSKLEAKQQRNHCTESGDPLRVSLDECGLTPEDIDTVILSHLHFDHAGGGTMIGARQQILPTFPNAVYFVQKGEWETATSGRLEIQAAYPQENMLALQDSGQLKMLQGEQEIVPGIRSLITPGHTAWHQSLLIESEGKTAVFLADLCPTWHHLPSLWCTAYDVDLLATRRRKPVILGQIADNDWLAISDHDPDYAAARLQRDARAEFVIVDPQKEL